MIPILYPASETQFTSNGIGRLSDAIECTVTEERNGIYELYLKYPITGKHFAEIAHSRIIAAVPADGKTVQPFRIYKISKPINGICEIYAEHISYEMNHIPVMPFTANSCVDALNGLVRNAAQACPFSVWTDKSVSAPYNLKHPEAFRALLGGVQGSILDVYGKGEYEFDRNLVKLYVNRGHDTGVTIRYAKNMVDLLQEESIEETITGVCPFWQNEETGEVVTLPEKAVWSATAANYPYKRTAVIDFTDEWETAPTVAQLRARTQKYIEDNNIGIPKVTLDVAFIPLWQANGVSLGTPKPTLEIGATVNGDTVENVDGYIDADSSIDLTVTDDEGNVTIASNSFAATEQDGNVTIPQNSVFYAVDDGEGNITFVPYGDSTLHLEDARWVITYEDYRVLERVNLCDTVTVLYDDLGVSVTAKVVKTVYNVLLDRYDSLEIGDPKTTFAQTLSNITEELADSFDNKVSSMRTWVQHQTDLITGGLGGYVVFGYNANGQPQEILIMDTDDPATAVNVIRMNKNGIGFSRNGYSGPFESAWTIDGVFNAAFIGAGSIKGYQLDVDAITANNIALYGKMGVYTDATLSTNGGFIGYMSGATASGSGTDGIAIMNPAGTNYVIATSRGVRMTNMSGSVPGEFWISEGIAEFQGKAAYLQGNVYLNAAHLNSEVEYVGTTRCNDLQTGQNLYITAATRSAGNLLRLTGRSDAYGEIYTYNADAKPLFYVGRQNYHGFVGVNTSAGARRVSLGIDADGIGQLILYDNDGGHVLTPALITKLYNL